MIPFPTALPSPFRGLVPEVWPLSSSDAAALSRLHSSAFPLAGDQWSAGEFTGLLLQPGVFGHRAIRGGAMGLAKPEPRGFVLAREAAGEAEVLTIAVHPSWQGRGIGRALMDALLRDLYARRAEALFLEVDEGNRGALTLYGRLGFREVGRRESYYAGGAHGSAALTMRLDLEGA